MRGHHAPTKEKRSGKARILHTIELTHVRKSPIALCGGVFQGLLNSPGAQVMNQDKNNISIPLERRLVIPSNNYARYDGQPVKTMFNLQYNLPNGKKAFIERFPEGEQGAILFYTNEDCSEIQVPEKYRREIPAEEICWIDNVGCDGLQIQNPITPGPKALRNIGDCIES